jgi:hypothetical protein
VKATWVVTDGNVARFGRVLSAHRIQQGMSSGEAIQLVAGLPIEACEVQVGL